ncbi:SGNH/GDSL hydrolase family protein [Streptomyces stelliscabiei]|uniref:SGNH/GDSL hydrolase family protein n=1 Tax=Streptomyces stelliscabiei TaxID=146820 RepID=UPI00062C38E1|nr:SGNH/GDSL hydrolase family protein [Streptomyces stelliscabiei]KND46487.1 SGNH hydrolase [Streptomyces stelliscabiei]MDX2516069.1 SGNH/GDSL hydrolase family protein [Streptomyces stelliscabiei]MDX2553041.1 SGNH/GDSL hydrolase family protein [Streptomyces stelliscabiei]MDX2612029.1 SGNH/GDSL hydrolase family protein [Streptomyces stelliscabiei]MDX2636367.1 SGNH/GDSL hydrolase family protein [Streptomyces stelliscabiei]
MLATCVLALALVVASSAVVALVASPQRAEGAGTGETASSARHWVNTWSAMPQLTEPGNMPPAPFTGERAVLVDTTLRQTVRVTTGGDRVRLRFSNAFGGSALPLTAVTVALPLEGRAGVAAIEPGTSRTVTFSGRESTTVPVGAQVVSDPLDFTLRPGTVLTVTAYLAEGQASLALTSHPGSRTTSYLDHGDRTEDADLPGATPTNHWYLLSDIEVLSRPATTSVAVLGDSLTDGRGSTTNGNNRWPDQLFDRLQQRPGTRHLAVVNLAAGGNRVLNDGLGPNALARLDRDILAHSAVEQLIVFEGVNDLGTAEATPAAQQRVTADLIAAYEQIVVRAHAQGIRVHGATLLPFGGNTPYDDTAGHREAARQAVNTWIRTSGRFDAVIDFDRAVRDPQSPGRLLPGLHDGDWLHLNPEGYRILAETVPARLLQRG